MFNSTIYSDVYRPKVIKQRESRCENCGHSGEWSEFHIHHKDRDRTNNSDENLLVLCIACHKIAHSTRDREDYDISQTQESDIIHEQYIMEFLSKFIDNHMDRKVEISITRSIRVFIACGLLRYSLIKMSKMLGVSKNMVISLRDKGKRDLARQILGGLSGEEKQMAANQAFPRGFVEAKGVFKSKTQYYVRGDKFYYFRSNKPLQTY